MKKIILFSLYVILILSCGSTNEETKKVDSFRLKFINEAYKYLKTPYKYAGTNKSGMDCSGLVYRSAINALDKSLPRSASAIAAYSKKIDIKKIQPGDLVFFITFGKKISHVGIYIGKNKFIHSASKGKKTGVIISSLSEDYWKDRFVFVGRFLPQEENFSSTNKE